MHRGQNLVLRLRTRVFFSWVPFGETLDAFREVNGLLSRFIGQKRTLTPEMPKSQIGNKSIRIRSSLIAT